ncbi:gliding motility-associated peptidyl-prolyl isomerase GldI [Maribacter litopenaei]|uniref:Peptidyl-prolyl cis-trans isomerase n=1 Tax=Maribacter litopenaei TaxID=2976127 RepID=A0ABY5YAE1_9FLAO|nr:gliding motility-associated peptidyl-prolyl isomerase GldI [Maribacter litopenaei]UWX56006.1 gliding motility-associated peptidyl-prolyl isomerase GldI [Maribacter litopenaei]
MRTLNILLLMAFLFGCEESEPRKPVQRKSGSYFKESIERSRKLLEAEEKKIQEIIKRDSLKDYTHSASGSWYHYLRVNDSTDYTPQTDDIVTMNYNLLTLDNDTLYSESEIGTLSYRVDKQELFLGLREAIKLLKVNEKATFLFPSSIAFGYHGDNNRIGTNVPLKSTITILNIEKQQDNLED